MVGMNWTEQIKINIHVIRVITFVNLMLTDARYIHVGVKPCLINMALQPELNYQWLNIFFAHEISFCPRVINNVPPLCVGLEFHFSELGVIRLTDFPWLIRTHRLTVIPIPCYVRPVIVFSVGIKPVIRKVNCNITEGTT